MTLGELNELAALCRGHRWILELEKAPFLTYCVTLGKERMGGCSEDLKMLHNYMQTKVEERKPPENIALCQRVGSVESSIRDNNLGFSPPSPAFLLPVCPVLPPQGPGS